MRFQQKEGFLGPDPAYSDNQSLSNQQTPNGQERNQQIFFEGLQPDNSSSQSGYHSNSKPRKYSNNSYIGGDDQPIASQTSQNQPQQQKVKSGSRHHQDFK